MTDVHMTTVVNLHHEKCDVYIGRGSRFGNSFSGNREESIGRYKTWFHKKIATDPNFKSAVEAIRGKRLGCYCKPKPCHGDVIVEFLKNHAGK